MNLLRSICCLFGGRCAEDEPRPTTQTSRGERPADLGQREAQREKASEDQLGRMEGEGGSITASGQSVSGRLRLS
jgi:hypothetical protein